MSQKGGWEKGRRRFQEDARGEGGSLAESGRRLVRENVLLEGREEVARDAGKMVCMSQLGLSQCERDGDKAFNHEAAAGQCAGEWDGVSSMIPAYSSWRARLYGYCCSTERELQSLRFGGWHLWPIRGLAESGDRMVSPRRFFQEASGRVCVLRLLLCAGMCALAPTRSFDGEPAEAPLPPVLRRIQPKVRMGDALMGP